MGFMQRLKRHRSRANHGRKDVKQSANISVPKLWNPAFDRNHNLTAISLHSQPYSVDQQSTGPPSLVSDKGSAHTESTTTVERPQELIAEEVPEQVKTFIETFVRHELESSLSRMSPRFGLGIDFGEQNSVTTAVAQIKRSDVENCNIGITSSVSSRAAKKEISVGVNHQENSKRPEAGGTKRRDMKDSSSSRKPQFPFSAQLSRPSVLLHPRFQPFLPTLLCGNGPSPAIRVLESQGFINNCKVQSPSVVFEDVSSQNQPSAIKVKMGDKQQSTVFQVTNVAYAERVPLKPRNISSLNMNMVPEPKHLVAPSVRIAVASGAVDTDASTEQGGNLDTEHIADVLLDESSFDSSPAISANTVIVAGPPTPYPQMLEKTEVDAIPAVSPPASKTIKAGRRTSMNRFARQSKLERASLALDKAFHIVPVPSVNEGTDSRPISLVTEGTKAPQIDLRPASVQLNTASPTQSRCKSRLSTPLTAPATVETASPVALPPVSSKSVPLSGPKRHLKEAPSTAVRKPVPKINTPVTKASKQPFLSAKTLSMAPQRGMCQFREIPDDFQPIPYKPREWQRWAEHASSVHARLSSQQSQRISRRSESKTIPHMPLELPPCSQAGSARYQSPSQSNLMIPATEAPNMNSQVASSSLDMVVGVPQAMPRHRIPSRASHEPHDRQVLRGGPRSMSLTNTDANWAPVNVPVRPRSTQAPQVRMSGSYPTISAKLRLSTQSIY